MQQSTQFTNHMQSCLSFDCATISGWELTDLDHHELSSLPAQTYERKLYSRFPSANHWTEYQSKANILTHIAILYTTSSIAFMANVTQNSKTQHTLCLRKMSPFYICDNLIQMSHNFANS